MIPLVHLSLFIPCACKAELPSDYHGLAHGDYWLAELLKEGKTKSPAGFSPEAAGI